MKSDFKWLFVGDLQIPYHDKRAVALFMKAAKRFKPDAIDIVGDIDDQLEYSSYSDGTTDEFFNQLRARHKKWEKEYSLAEKVYEKLKTDDERFAHLWPTKPDLDPLPFVKENATGARQFYTAVREQHPDADIHSSLGNHDIRIYKYMDRKSPEHVDLMTPNVLWGLDDLGITWKMYHERPMERFAGIHVHHGTTSTGLGLSVKNDIENMDISLVRGHDHRGGVVYKSYPISDRRLVGMGTGHLCNVDAYGLQYADNPTWEQGFGIGHVIDGTAHLQFIPIVDYTCIIDGFVLKG